MAKQKLPSIPLETLTVEIFSKIIEIYAQVTGKKLEFILNYKIFPDHETQNVRKELQDGISYCEWRLGSSLTKHSKLFAHGTKKNGAVYVAFDFDPNTANDSQRSAVVMREKFHQEIREYFNALPHQP